jgi:membrane protein DedA with SNARE-associated domain
MSDWIFEHLRVFFADFGYWTVVIVLLLENMGVPVPGEATLLFASFLAWSEHSLGLPYIIIFGIFACTVGDNIGYFIGRRGGRPLLDRYKHIFRISNAVVRHAEGLFARHGAVTVFFARFVFGLRIIAGPLAGVLGMPWRRFFLFNFLGATTWVTVIATVGYVFGRHWETLVRIIGRTNAILAVVAVFLIAWAIRRYRERHIADRDEPDTADAGEKLPAKDSETAR